MSREAYWTCMRACAHEVLLCMCACVRAHACRYCCVNEHAQQIQGASWSPEHPHVHHWSCNAPLSVQQRTPVSATAYSCQCNSILLHAGMWHAIVESLDPFHSSWMSQSATRSKDNKGQVGCSGALGCLQAALVDLSLIHPANYLAGIDSFNSLQSTAAWKPWQCVQTA